MSTIDRRTVLTGAAAAIPAAAIAAVPALAAADADDPVFSLIEAHKRLAERHLALIRCQAELEITIPGDKRRTTFYVYDDEIVQGDDPRWIALKLNWIDYRRKNWEVENAITLAEPTTIAGIAALLRHLADDEIDFFGRPAEYEDDAGKTFTVASTFLDGMADALESIATAGAAS